MLCDLDGVVWLDRRPIPGSAEAVARLRRAGVRVVFVTNNSTATTEVQEAALAAVGIDAVGHVATSAHAVAGLVEPGARVLVCGEEGIREALRRRGAVLVDGSGVAPDDVVVGLDRHADYDLLRRLATAVREGARFLASNDDATFPTPDGPIPGAGTLVAAVRTASGCDPLLAGKPHEPMAQLVARLVGPGFRPEDTLVVGDRPSTDGAFADTVGARFALVRSGVTTPGAAPEAGGPVPWLDVADLAAVVRHVLGDGDGSVAAW